MQDPTTIDAKKNFGNLYGNKKALEEKKEFDYRKNNWGYRGQRFNIGPYTIEQSPSGTFYLIQDNGSIRKVTRQFLDELQAKVEAENSIPANSVEEPNNNELEPSESPTT
jgi:hypothetical protein